MSFKVRFIVALVIIIIVSWFDYHYLSQYPANFPVDNIRRFIHIALLVVIMLVGGFTWAKCPLVWIRALWWYAYIFAIGFLLVIGLVAHVTGAFNYPLLYAVYEFRMFFCSPLPMFILLIFSRIGK